MDIPTIQIQDIKDLKCSLEIISNINEYDDTLLGADIGSYLDPVPRQDVYANVNHARGRTYTELHKPKSQQWMVRTSDDGTVYYKNNGVIGVVDPIKHQQVKTDAIFIVEYISIPPDGLEAINALTSAVINDSIYLHDEVKDKAMQALATASTDTAFIRARSYIRIEYGIFGTELSDNNKLSINGIILARSKYQLTRKEKTEHSSSNEYTVTGHHPVTTEQTTLTFGTVSGLPIEIVPTGNKKHILLVREHRKSGHEERYKRHHLLGEGMIIRVGNTEEREPEDHSTIQAMVIDKAIAREETMVKLKEIELKLISAGINVRKSLADLIGQELKNKGLALDMVKEDNRLDSAIEDALLKLAVKKL